MAKATWVNVNGNWKQVKNVWTKINGTWKQKVIPKGKISNVWKEFIAYNLTKDWVIEGLDIDTFSSLNISEYKNCIYVGGYKKPQINIFSEQGKLIEEIKSEDLHERISDIYDYKIGDELKLCVFSLTDAGYFNYNPFRREGDICRISTSYKTDRLKGENYIYVCPYGQPIFKWDVVNHCKIWSQKWSVGIKIAISPKILWSVSKADNISAYNPQDGESYEYSSLNLKSIKGIAADNDSYAYCIGGPEIVKSYYDYNARFIEQSWRFFNPSRAYFESLIVSKNKNVYAIDAEGKLIKLDPNGKLISSYDLIPKDRMSEYDTIIMKSSGTNLYVMHRSAILGKKDRIIKLNNFD